MALGWISLIAAVAIFRGGCLRRRSAHGPLGGSTRAGVEASKFVADPMAPRCLHKRAVGGSTPRGWGGRLAALWSRVNACGPSTLPIFNMPVLPL
jgi:hypothetical protein